MISKSFGDHHKYFSKYTALQKNMFIALVSGLGRDAIGFGLGFGLSILRAELAPDWFVVGAFSHMHSPQ